MNMIQVLKSMTLRCLHRSVEEHLSLDLFLSSQLLTVSGFDFLH